jgi:hypothetical protein
MDGEWTEGPDPDSVDLTGAGPMPYIIRYDVSDLLPAYAELHCLSNSRSCAARRTRRSWSSARTSQATRRSR